MKKACYLVILLFLTVQYSFSQTKNWNELKEKEYSIKYPKDWDLDQSGEMGTKLILFSQLSSEKDDFKENVNLIIQDLSQHDVDLDKYVVISEEQVATLIPNGVILSSKRIKKKKQEYHKMIFTGIIGEIKVKYEQRYWVTNESAFVLTLTCKTNEFNDYKKIGEGILNSFSLN
jgi:hypothetical protein